MTDRRCLEHGCGAVLSRYNPTDYCWTHRRTVRGGLAVNGVMLGCGTEAGYSRHKRRGEPPCHTCLDAHRRYLGVRRLDA